MSRRPRLTVRARLTLLYTGLFAVCGATVVAVSYILVARLEPQGSSQQAPASFLARCRSEQLKAHPNGRLLAKLPGQRRQGSQDYYTKGKSGAGNIHHGMLGMRGKVLQE